MKNKAKKFIGTVNEATVQEDGKIICVGLFTEYNGVSSVGVARLNVDGSLDEPFSTNSGVGFSGGSAVSVTFKNDKILVSGSFISYNGNTSRNLVRINIDGTYDSTLNIGTGFVGTVYDPTVLSDGKILVTGNFSALNGSTVSTGILRLNSDGSVDNSFNTGTGFNPNARFIYVDDKQIYYTGSINSYDTTPANRIIRLNSDGTIDNTFVYGSGFDSSTQKVAIDSTSKIIVTGTFLNYNTTPANRIIRLNNDGTVDSSFVYGSGFDGNTQYLTINQSSIYVSGSFTSYNGTSVGRIARLDLDLAKIINVTSPNIYTTLTKGQTATITINYDEPITVDTTNGSPTLTLNLTDCKANNLNRLATYVSGSGTNSLTFTYPTQPGDITNQLDYLNQNSLTLNGSTIKDAVGNNILNTLPTPGQANSLSQSNIKVEDPSCNNIATPTAPNTGTNNRQNLILTTLGLLTLITLATYTIYKTRNKTYIAK